MITYSTDKRLAANLETITAERAREIIEMNKRGEKPEMLQTSENAKAPAHPIDLLADADISRFDKSKKKRKPKKNGCGERRDNRRNENNQENRGNTNGDGNNDNRRRDRATRKPNNNGRQQTNDAKKEQ